MAFLGQEEQIREFQDRFKYLYAILFLGLGLLLSRLVYLQILKGDEMRHFSEENRIKRVRVAAPRGMIFDRNGKLLIDNRPAFDLVITPQYLHESKRTKQVIKLLSTLIHIPEHEIREKLYQARYEPAFMPVRIKMDLTRQEVAEIESWKIDMPGVEVREVIKRTDIYGDVAAHLLGYIGEVTATELPILNKYGVRYKLGDDVGKSGLEQKMERTLRGKDGEDIKEVDALGRMKLQKGKNRMLSSIHPRAPIPGKNLILTIDQDLQLAATNAFGNKIGAMVALDPRSGQVLAMMSRPSFDPTEFSRGISSKLWAKLLQNPNHPLTDKTIQEHYPPGSTFKLITAIAGLEEGVINAKTEFHCPGYLRVGNRIYHCWKKGGHGNVNVVSALTHSCDVFFYHVALKLKSVDEIAKWAHALGLGKKTGIDLAREVPGLIPTVEWKRKRFGAEWNPGETVNVAIGQGYVLTTAIQLANAYATFANGGTLYRPYLIKRIESYQGKVLKTFHPVVMGHVDLHPETIKLVKEGLWDVVNTPGGTGYAHRLPGMDMAGKTGTAQVVRLAGHPTKCENMKYQDRDDALFVGFAPVNHPVIAVAVVAEHDCHPGYGAIPVAAAVIKTYLQKYYPNIYGGKALAARIKAERLTDYTMPTSSPTGGSASGSGDEDVRSDNPNLPLPKELDQEAPPPLPPPAKAQ